MQEDFRLIVDFVSVLAAAAAGGLLAALGRQPPLLGYLLGGMIVGPAGLGWIKELIQIETLAQFGVAFLLFALGVEFSLAELKKVRAIALGGGLLQIALSDNVGIIALDELDNFSSKRSFSRLNFVLVFNCCCPQVLDRT